LIDSCRIERAFAACVDKRVQETLSKLLLSSRNLFEKWTVGSFQHLTAFEAAPMIV